MAKTTTQQLENTLDATTNLVNATTILTWFGIIFMVLMIFGVVFGISKSKKKADTRNKPSLKKPVKSEWIIVGIVTIIFIVACVAVFFGIKSL